MARFSERIGVVEQPPTLQVQSVNDALRNSLWNLIHSLYESEYKHYWPMVARHVAKFFRKVPVDELPLRDDECRNWLKNYFFSLPWHQVYDFIEFVADNHQQMTQERKDYGYGPESSYHHLSNDQVRAAFNQILERELSAYRFVARILSPISDETEIREITEATESAARAGLKGATEHIRTALDLLGKKPDPDYRNSIKEAISAVESIAKQISGGKSKGLDAALDALAQKSELHGALKAGFKSLYGFSSDADGIRHAILDEPNVGFAEAKYMIVACSAFVNYLIQKADAAGLLGR
jgi:AbiJ N-terminal domain 4